MNFGSPLMPENPPHVWGIRRHILLKSLLPGITPTCVGKTAYAESRIRFYRDHPHMCGESTRSIRSPIPGIGSPPHVWGRPLATFSGCVKVGITPTYVGKADWHQWRSFCSQDHPHMRGESLNFCLSCSSSRGSPPHVWGIPKDVNYLVWLHRITLTCVGNTVSDRHAHGNP